MRFCPASIHRRSIALFAVMACLAVGGRIAGQTETTGSGGTWPAWRGPLGNGVAPDAVPPVTWSEKHNIRWKVAVPGRGHGTPIVWTDRLYVLTSVPVGDSIAARYSGAPGAHDNAPVTHRSAFIVQAMDRKTGDVVWKRTVHHAIPHEGAHVSASLASASPVTDGRRIYAHFGSYGLYCLDADGGQVWHRNFGPMRSKHGHGEGSSPVLHEETLIVNWDHEGESFVVALDKWTGATRWRTSRDEPTSWATPIVVEQDDTTLVIVSGTHRIRAYDFGTGNVVWECGGLSANVVASPVAGGGIVFAGSSYNTRCMLAIQLHAAAGDITDSSHVAWKRTRGAPYVPSPLLYGDALYYLSHYQPVMTRLKARSGAPRPGPFRLEGLGSIYASPVAAAGRIYVTDLEGTTLVMTSDDVPAVLAINRLDDVFSASAALAGRECFLRGRRFLYCIGDMGDGENAEGQ